jgi:hypothetical protein
MAANETVTNMADVTNQLIADAANAEAQRDAVLARIAELEVAQAALSAVTTATEDMHEKAFALYWLGRRDIEEARHGPGGPAIDRIMEEHVEEAEKIANGDAWEHGYWAGTLSFLRLIMGLSTTEGYVGDDETITAEMIRASALEEYPCLDS